MNIIDKLLLLGLMRIAMVSTALVHEKCYEEKPSGSVFKYVPNYKPQSLTGDTCLKACLDLDDSINLAGITQGGICLCGTAGSINWAEFQGTCNKDCSADPMLCGGENSAFLVIGHFSGQASPTHLDFTPQLNGQTSAEETVLQLTSLSAHSDSSYKFHLYYQIGLDGFPSAFYAGGDPQQMITYSDIPGSQFVYSKYSVGENIITAFVTDGDGLVTFVTSTAFTVEDKAVPLSVGCPPVAEKDEPLKCIFSFVGELSDDMSIRFSESSSASSYDTMPYSTMKGSSHRFGLRPPSKTLPGAQLLKPSGPKKYILRDSRVTAPARVHSISVGPDAEVPDLKVIIPDCPNYNPMNGYCENSEPDLVRALTNVMQQTCSADAPFSSSTSQCCSESCDGSSPSPSSYTVRCTVSATPPATSALNGVYVIPHSETECIMYPGDMIAIEEPVHEVHNLDEPDLADLDENFQPLANGARAAVEVTVQDIQYVSFEYSCKSPGSSITAEILYQDVLTSNTSAKCQEPIDGLEVDCVPDETEIEPHWADGELYIAVGEQLTCTMRTTMGLPIFVHIDWKGDNETLTDELEITDESEARSKSFVQSYTEEGTMYVNLTATNLHSEVIHGSVKFNHNTSNIVHVQYPVKDFQITGDTEWITGNGSFTLTWELEDGKKYPSAPKLTCDWGDGVILPNKEDFNCTKAEDDCSIQYEFTQYGDFNISCTMENQISSQTLNHEVTIYEALRNFEAFARYVSKGQDPDTGELKLPLGPELTMIPVDQEVTFVISYEQGTIEELHFYLVTEEGALESLRNFSVPNKFDATNVRVHIPFTEENTYTVTVIALNKLESANASVVFQMVGEVKGMILSDGNEISNKEEVKWFYLEFESIGAGTCVILDFDDGILQSFGDSSYCSEYAPDAEFDSDTVLDNPMQIPHTYYYYGVFTVTAMASTFTSNASITSELDVIVTSASCQPPDVSIVGSAKYSSQPMQYKRTDAISFKSLTGIDCSGVTNTRKQWTITYVEIDPETGQEHVSDEDEDIVALAPDWYDKSELALLPRSLHYGVYKVSLSVRIWDEDDEDPNLTRLLPFERDAFTFIEILPTPLLAYMVQGDLSYITRGVNQYLNLQPSVWSSDPDFPEDKSEGMSFRYFCRQIEEDSATLSVTYPENYTMDATNPDELQYNTAEAPLIMINKDRSSIRKSVGGCFGTGYGPLDHTSGELQLKAEAFILEDQLYEFRLEVRKDVRMSYKLLQVKIEKGSPPIMSIVCGNPKLCFPDDQGIIFVNPTARLLLIAECSVEDNSNCKPDMKYKWSIKDKDLMPVSDLDMTPFYVAGYEDKEVGLKVDFFTQGPETARQAFYLCLESENGDGVSALNMMKFIVNRAPENGSCTITPPEGTSLMTNFEFICTDWVDPEEKGIAGYSVAYKSAGNPSAPLQSLFKTDSFNDDTPQILQFKIGVYEIYVTIEDAWGAKTVLLLNEVVIVNAPAADAMEDLFSLDLLDQLGSSGDSQKLLMVLQAQSQILQAMNVLVKNTGANPTDPVSAQIMANTIGSIVGSPAESAELSDIGQELTQQATSALKNVVNSLVDMEVADPEELIPAIEDIAGTLGTLLDQAMSSAALSSDYDSSPDDESGTGNDYSSPYDTYDDPNVPQMSGLCKGVKVVDLASWDKPFMEYDTLLSEDPDLEIPEDASQLRCGGVISAAKNAATEVSTNIIEMLKELGLKMLSNLVLSEAKVVQNGPITIYSKMTAGPELKEWHLVGTDEAKDAKFSFPPNWCLGELEIVYDPKYPESFEMANVTCHTPAGITAISYEVNPLCNVQTCDRLAKDTKMLDIYITTRDSLLVSVNKVYDQKRYRGIKIDIPRTNDSLVGLPAPVEFDAPNLSQRRLGPPMMIHEVLLDRADVMLVVEITTVHEDQFVALLLDYERIPTVKQYEYGAMTHLNNSRVVWNSIGQFYRLDVPESVIQNRTGRWFLTILNLTHFIPDKAWTEKRPLSQVHPDLELIDFQEPYQLRTWTSGCYYYNDKTKAWVSDGLIVRESHYGWTGCRSDHLTSFATGFHVIPNTVDFDYIFAHASFEDNITIYFCVIITLVAFLALLIWARYQDLRDETRLVTRALVDNHRKDPYLYEILTYTGIWKQSSCCSKVYLFISGSEDDTEDRLLDPGWKDTLRRATVDSYLLRTPKSLGNLNYIRIWHDNSGRNNFASWFCSAIVIRDVQTSEEYEFIINDWLACEKGDEEIERFVPCSSEAKGTDFSYHMYNNLEQCFKEYHLWMSIFMRSKRSRFTRCERTGVSFSMLYLSLLTNAIWYEKVPEQITEGLRLGLLNVGWPEVYVGLLSNAITFLPVLLMMVLFWKAGRRVLRKNRIDLAREKEDQSLYSDSSSSGSSSFSESEEDDNDMIMGYKRRRSQNGITFNTYARRKRKFVIPWFFRYIGWALVCLCMLVSIFFLFSYGIMFGNDKTHQWLSSCLVSFLAGLLFLEPLKVVLVALCLSCCCNVSLGSDDVDQDEERAHIASRWRKKSRALPNMSAFRPVDEIFLEIVRKKRQKEVEMWNIVHELVFYVVFIIIIYVISYGNRDPASFMLQNQMENNFVRKNGYDKLNTSNDWWEWAHKTLVDDLRAQSYYNGMPPYGLRGFIGDKVNRIIGYAVLRQVRVKPNTCRVDKRVRNITQECAKESRIVDEDHSDYCNAWEEQTALTENFPSCVRQEFKYTTAEELNGLSYTAFVDSYTGGGYVYRLNKAASQVRVELRQLQQLHWINNHTRGLFLEFSTYNANLNLFVIATMVAEFIPGGGVLPYSRFEVVRLLHHHSSAGAVILAAESAFAVYVLGFLLTNLAAMKRLGRAYWKTYWNLAEWAIIVLSAGSGVLYAYRLLLTAEILDTFAATNGNGYLKLQEVGVVDELYGYGVGLILFVANIKFVKLLRFNNRFEVLLRTLKTCWVDLSGFLLVFLLVFFAFVQVFYMILHNDLLEFHTLVAALETCFTMMLNKFKFGSIRQTSMTAAAMFFTFAISCSFILINVMLTIIIEAYEVVRNDLKGRGNQYEILDFVTHQTRLHFGTEDLPRTESVLKRDRGQRAFEHSEKPDTRPLIEEPSEEVLDVNTEALPSKVDRFLEFINEAYLEGQLNLRSKKMMANYNKYVGDPDASVSAEKDQFNSQKKIIYNADNPQRVKSGNKHLQ